MRILMIFCDGVGIGLRDPLVNPFFAADLPALRTILGGVLPSLRQRRIVTPQATHLPLDATLGVPGLPQSGTGQTALFTGRNAARFIGKHFGPYPYSSLRPLIASGSIFQQLLRRRRRPFFANAYPQRFFDYMERHPARYTVTTYAALQAGLRLLGAEDLFRGRGVSADLTGEGWHALGYPTMPTITPEEAGRRLARLLDDFDFVLFEFWSTDKAGHARDKEKAVQVLEQLDALVRGMISQIDSRRDLVLLTSDHGNLEDLATKSHTRHPVPAIMFGHRHRELAERLERARSRGPTLCDVAPALLSMMTEGG